MVSAKKRCSQGKTPKAALTLECIFIHFNNLRGATLRRTTAHQASALTKKAGCFLAKEVHKDSRNSFYVLNFTKKHISLRIVKILSKPDARTQLQNSSKFTCAKAAEYSIQLNANNSNVFDAVLAIENIMTIMQFTSEINCSY
jgi:hypothetical protein